MKKPLLFIFALVVYAINSYVSAQNINIPDANFKNALIAAGVDKNGDGEIQESEALAIDSLVISRKQISNTTGIEYFKNLKHFNCQNNQIITLDASNLTNLTSLVCSGNKITSLDVKKLSKLTNLNYGSNKLTSIDVSNLTNLVSLGSYSNPLTSLDLSNLINLKNLDCSASQLTSLILSNLNSLEVLNCSSNSFTSLEVSNLPNLKELYCNGHIASKLTSLSLSNLNSLEILECSYNRYTSLNLSDLQNLRKITCRGGDTTLLDNLILNNLPSLNTLDCSSNRLTSLDLSNVPSLRSLSCTGNRLTNLNVSNLTNLVSLRCSSNPNLTSLDLGNLTNLTTLDCTSNRLTNLNLSNLINLITLDCASNRLTSLDLNNLTSLTSLNCALNRLTSLNLDNLKKLGFLKCSNNQLTKINVSHLTYLKDLQCGGNTLTNLNLDNLKNLEVLSCGNNQLTELNVAHLNKLTDFYCHHNQLKNLDLNNLTNLNYFNCEANELTNLDLSGSKRLDFFICRSNPIEVLYLKNGVHNRFTGDSEELRYNIFEEVPNLKYICIDSIDVASLKAIAINLGFPGITINSLCSATSVGVINSMIGKVKSDLNKDGCDETDVTFPNLKIKISNVTDSDYVISGDDGNFSTHLVPGTYTFLPILDHTDYFDVTPTSATYTLPDTISPTFCITPKGNFNDLAISIIPVRAARPGFSDATYKVVYKNQGTTTQSGNVTFSFDDDKMNVISSSPAADQSDFGLLTFNFTNLAPFESRSALVTMRTNAPTDNPAVNVNDVLNFSANITAQTDETPDDNTAVLYQTVIGSYDPNDKTCLEGDIITPDMIGKRVNYLIRFENTGTAPAENVVVTDYIDTTVFDVNSLLVTDASHQCHTQISKGNKVQFIFSDIQLPFTEPDKHGFVAFSIQLKDHLQIGDSIKNQADIYFDYNLPITTNEAISEVKNRIITSVKQRISDIQLSVYPNPSKGNFSVELKSNQSSPIQITVIDIEGKIVFAKQYTAQQSLIPIQLEKLPKGTYLVQAQSENDIVSRKIVIQ